MLHILQEQQLSSLHLSDTAAAVFTLETMEVTSGSCSLSEIQFSSLHFYLYIFM